MHPMLTTHHCPTYTMQIHAQPTQQHAAGCFFSICMGALEQNKPQDTVHIHAESSSHMKMKACHICIMVAGPHMASFGGEIAV